MTLYEITENYRQLLWIAEDPEASTEAFEECMGQLNDELEVKADSYVTVIKSLEADNEMDQKEVARLQARVNTRKRNAKRMKETLMEAMADHSHILDCCKCKPKYHSAGGYIWKYERSDDLRPSPF